MDGELCKHPVALVMWGGETKQMAAAAQLEFDFPLGAQPIRREEWMKGRYECGRSCNRVRTWYSLAGK